MQPALAYCARGAGSCPTAIDAAHATWAQCRISLNVGILRIRSRCRRSMSNRRSLMLGALDDKIDSNRRLASARGDGSESLPRRFVDFVGRRGVRRQRVRTDPYWMEGLDLDLATASERKNSTNLRTGGLPVRAGPGTSTTASTSRRADRVPESLVLARGEAVRVSGRRGYSRRRGTVGRFALVDGG